MLSSDLEYCLNEAFQQARSDRHEYMTVEHLLLALLDIPQVADVLQATGVELARLRKELKVLPDQLVQITEFMHPRVEEICDTLPAWLGAYILRTAPLSSAIAVFCRRGRKVKSRCAGSRTSYSNWAASI